MMKAALRSNTTIDGLRVLLIMVIAYIHCQPLLGTLVIADPTLNFIYDKVVALTVLALPIFFVISGYFLYGAKSDSARWQKLVKLLKILMWSELLYLVIAFALGGIKANLMPFFNFQYLINLFTGAVPIPIADGVSNLPLWYLVCMAIVSFVEWFAGKYRGKVLATMAIIGFLIGNLHGWYAGFADNSIIIPLLDRVFGTDLDYLTQGFLFISIGYFVHKYQAKIAQIPGWILAAALPISYVLFLFEKQYLTTNGFMVPIITALVIMLCVVKPKLFSGKLKILANWGARYSLYVYIFHPIVIFILNHLVLTWLAPANLLTMTAYWLAVCLISLLVSVGFVRAKDFLIPKIKLMKEGINGKVKKFLE
jgi:peptidoglycan/LPS O-acetylase OafA/YrhL